MVIWDKDLSYIKLIPDYSFMIKHLDDEYCISYSDIEDNGSILQSICELKLTFSN